MYNRFTEKRRRYLRERRDGIYTGMLLTGKLDDYLKENRRHGAGDVRSAGRAVEGNRGCCH